MSGLSITVNADSIGDMAQQLMSLAVKFNGITNIMAMIPDDSPVAALTDTPLEDAIKRSPPATIPTPPAASPVKPPRAKKAAADKEAKPPVDRFFATDDAPKAEDQTAVQAAVANGAAVNTSYTAEMTDSDAYLQLRAKAKLYHDDNGPDVLRERWVEAWADICPEDPEGTPGIKRLDPNPPTGSAAPEGNRANILRALAVFDNLTGHDPVTGELIAGAAGDPAADLL